MYYDDLNHHISLAIFFLKDTSYTELYTLSLHDALPISKKGQDVLEKEIERQGRVDQAVVFQPKSPLNAFCMFFLARDRKSTRLNSSHVAISYAVYCLKKKKPNDSKICCVMTLYSNNI